MNFSKFSEKLPDMSVSVGNLTLSSPLMIASGVWPHEAKFWREPYTNGVGAICSKGLTRHPRSGNKGTRIWETSSGLLNSIGLQNSGIEAFVAEELPEISGNQVPVVVNLAIETLEEAEEGLILLKSAKEHIAAIELNVSCPNVDFGGMAWGVSEEGVAQVLAATRPLWEGELWVKLTPQVSNLVDVAKVAQEMGADALVVANTWLGMAIDVDRKKPVFERVVAGLSGPAVFPLALKCVYEAAGAVSIPVIGCGGVSCGNDALAMLLAGAVAVEVGSMLLHDLLCMAEIHDQVRRKLTDWNASSVRDIIGKGRSEGF